MVIQSTEDGLCQLLMNMHPVTLILGQGGYLEDIQTQLRGIKNWEITKELVKKLMLEKPQIWLLKNYKKFKAEEEEIFSNFKGEIIGWFEEFKMILFNFKERKITWYSEKIKWNSGINTNVHRRAKEISTDKL